MTTPDVSVVEVSQEDIDTLRADTGAPVDAYSDIDLARIIALNLDDDGTTNLLRSSKVVWDKEAARFARLVDVSESGSSRKMGDLYKNAIAMSALYDKRLAAIAVDTPEEQAALRPRSRRIVRRT